MNFIIDTIFQSLVVVCICVLLPIIIVRIIGKVKENETNREAEIMLKALDKGIISDISLHRNTGKTIKERLLRRLTGACVTGFLGLAFAAVGIVMHLMTEWRMPQELISMVYLIGGVLLAIGIALLIAYFAGKKVLAKEIEAEEKRLAEGK